MTAVPHRTTFRTPCPLSERQLEVLLWLAEGKTAAEIAIIMGITCNTSTNHIANAKRAVGVNKDTALVATAFRRGWIQ